MSLDATSNFHIMIIIISIDINLTIIYICAIMSIICHLSIKPNVIWIYVMRIIQIF
jgi:hypothetical protein